MPRAAAAVAAAVAPAAVVVPAAVAAFLLQYIYALHSPWGPFRRPPPPLRLPASPSLSLCGPGRPGGGHKGSRAAATRA